MIIEISNLNTKEINENSIIIFRDGEFKCISINEFLKPYSEKALAYEVELDNLSKRIQEIEKLNLPNEINKINMSKITNAFLMLVNDIEEGVIDTPEDYAKIKEYVLNPTQEIPDILKNYIKE